MAEFSSDRTGIAPLVSRLFSPLGSLPLSPSDRGETSGEVHLAMCGDGHRTHTHHRIHAVAGGISRFTSTATSPTDNADVVATRRSLEFDHVDRVTLE